MLRRSEFQWPPTRLNHQVIQWNAAISNAVNEKQTREGYHVMTMHPSVAHRDISTVVEDHGRPTHRGYEKMGYDFAEALYMAARKAWIEDPEIDSSSETSSVASGNSTVASVNGNSSANALRREAGTLTNLPV